MKKLSLVGLMTVGYALAVCAQQTVVLEGAIQQGSNSAFGAYSVAIGSNTMAEGDYSMAGGFNAWVKPGHSNALIFATGQPGAMRETILPNAAHFNRLILFDTASNHPNSVLARWENDLLYATTNQGAKAETAIQPGTDAALSSLKVTGTITGELVVARIGYSSAGGNPRGTNAVDLQTCRSNDADVASGDYAVVAGGSANAAIQIYCAVVGGNMNYAGGTNGSASFVGGGRDNRAEGWSSTIAGGQNGRAMQALATIGGGQGSLAGGACSTVAGGDRNEANWPPDWQAFGFVGGGSLNKAQGMGAAIAGGQENRALDGYAFVGAGFSNTASGLSSTIPGGARNIAAGFSSFAAGHNANAMHNGAFVWAGYDGSSLYGAGVPFASTGTNQFLISASGGVGIGTNAPQAQLHVAGSVRIDGPITIERQGDLEMGIFTSRP